MPHAGNFTLFFIINYVDLYFFTAVFMLNIIYIFTIRYKVYIGGFLEEKWNCTVGYMHFLFKFKVHYHLKVWSH